MSAPSAAAGARAGDTGMGVVASPTMTVGADGSVTSASGGSATPVPVAASPVQPAPAAAVPAISTAAVPAISTAASPVVPTTSVAGLVASPASPAAVGSKLVAAATSAPVAVNVHVATAAEWRRRLLLRKVHCTTVEPSADTAKRILSDMAMTLNDLGGKFGTAVPQLLRRPIPYDAANPLKPALTTELMEPAGGEPLSQAVWQPLRTAYGNTPQKTPVVLVTGVSGMGKTKAAYDLGRDHVFVIVSRVVEHDQTTAPWSTFRSLVGAIQSSTVSGVPDPLVEEDARAVLAALMLLLGAHLEWALDVSEAASSGDNRSRLRQLATARAAPVGAVESSRDAEVAVLRELVLRAQRNGLAYSEVDARLRRALQRALSKPGVMEENGLLNFRTQVAFDDYVRPLVDRARRVWGTASEELPRMMWAHDEAQALLGMLPRTLLASLASPETLAAQQDCGAFYGLLHALKFLTGCLVSGHVLLGSDLQLSGEMLAKHSPAQGISTHVDKAVRLTSDEIRSWLGQYLSDAAMRGVTSELLDQLQGRPLFVSNFWQRLLVPSSGRVELPAEPAAGQGPALTPAAAAVAVALRECYKDALDRARERIVRFWDDERQSATYGALPRQLMQRLTHHYIMEASAVPAHDLQALHPLVRTTIERGILNWASSGDFTAPDWEPVTEQAFRLVGAERVRRGTDGILQLLAAQVTSATGSQSAVTRGYALESCMAWLLVHKCLRAPSQSLTLGELLAPLLGRVDCMLRPRGDDVVDGRLWPSVFDDFVVRLTRGCDGSGQYWNSHCPLSVLAADPQVLLHHTTDSMGGADLAFVATPKSGAGPSKLVLLQLKNRESGTLRDAMYSVDLGKWYTDIGSRETPAHADMRRVLTSRSEWLTPVRAVVMARPYTERLLLEVTWLNWAELAQSPVLLLQMTNDRLGADIMPTGALAQCDVPKERNWKHCLWPHPVRHWAASAAPQPALPAVPDSWVAASLSVKVLRRDAKRADVREALQQYAEEYDDKATIGRWWRGTAKVTFRRAVTALNLVRRGPFKVKEQEVEVAFC